MSETISAASAAPKSDEFGAIEFAPLSRMQMLAARHLTASASQIPHVTHFDEIDVTAAEAARKQSPDPVSLLSLLIGAVTRALKDFPSFNASLDLDASQVVLKRYVNIGVAIDTPRGLVVGVLKNVEEWSPAQITEGVDDLATRARGRGLPLADLSGGGFTVSALGRLGGLGFTPIINAPQVAILGVANLRDVPRRGEGNAVEWRRVMPVSLSYDHRVINGADAGRFMLRLAEYMNDATGLSLGD